MSGRDALEAPLTRRRFLSRAAIGGMGMVGVAAAGRALRAQSAAQTPAQVDSANLFAMNQTASRPVRLPPRPGAHPSMTSEQRDALEHQIRCQCGCTLDVFTCRTTDFTCQVSPAMHRDVMALVEGGYGAQEIIDAFVGVYGQRVLMAPRKEGFDLVGWLAPFVALAAGAIAVSVLIHRWRPRATAGSDGPAPTPHVEGTAEELARIEAAVRDDE